MAILKYSAARLGLVVLLFLVCLWLQLGIVMSGVVALVAAFCISYLFFGRMRTAAAAQMGSRVKARSGRRSQRELDDAAAEDSYWDEQPERAAAPPTRQGSTGASPREQR